MAVAAVVATAACRHAPPRYPHGTEPIGTVRQIYETVHPSHTLFASSPTGRSHPTQGQVIDDWACCEAVTTALGRTL